MSQLAQPWLSVAGFVRRMGLETDDCPLDVQSKLQIAEALRGACAWIERQTSRRILYSKYVRRFDGTGAKWLAVPFAPIHSLISVQIGTTEQTVLDVDTAQTTHGVYHDGKRIYISGGCGVFPKGCANIRVEYYAGHLPELVPGDIVQATQILAAIAWKERDRAGDKSITLPTNSENFVKGLEGSDAKTIKSLTNWCELYVPRGIPIDGDEECFLGLFELGECEMG